MLTVRKNTQPTVADLFSDFFESNFLDRFDNSFKVSPRTNIHENENSYEVELMVPGFKKGDFNVNIENDVLTITAHKEEKKEEKDGKKVIFSEFMVENFERSFRLSKKVDINKVDASYEDGILKILIPKKEEAFVKKLIKIK